MGLATVSEGLRTKWTRVPDGEISQRDGPQAAQKCPHIQYTMITVPHILCLVSGHLRPAP